jgi:hypothetical protein
LVQLFFDLVAAANLDESVWPVFKNSGSTVLGGMIFGVIGIFVFGKIDPYRLLNYLFTDSMSCIISTVIFLLSLYTWYAANPQAMSETAPYAKPTAPNIIPAIASPLFSGSFFLPIIPKMIAVAPNTIHTIWLNTGSQHNIQFRATDKIPAT